MQVPFVTIYFLNNSIDFEIGQFRFSEFINLLNQNLKKQKKTKVLRITSELAEIAKLYNNKKIREFNISLRKVVINILTDNFITLSKFR